VDLGRLLDVVDPEYVVWLTAVHDNAVEAINRMNK
jgi:hypothetical protein